MTAINAGIRFVEGEKMTATMRPYPVTPETEPRRNLALEHAMRKGPGRVVKLFGILHQV